MALHHPPRSRSRRRRLVGLAVVLCGAAGAGTSLSVSASAPPDTAPGSVPSSPPSVAGAESSAPATSAATTTVPPACAAAGTGATSTVADAEAGTSDAATTEPTTTTTTTSTSTVAPTSTGAPPTAAVPTIDVPLPEGSTAADGSAPVPPGSLTPDQQIVLGRDGIGIARFCDDADTVIAAVTALLGDPSDDTGWSDPLSVSNCAGTEVRRVTWGSLDLYFGDSSRFASGVRHLFGYVYGNRDSLEVTPQGLSTPEGIGVGSTVEYLLANYPGAEVFPGEEGIADPLFYVDENLGGFLTDHAADGVVTVLFGGEDCGV